MSYIIKVEQQVDVDNILKLLDNGYELKPMVGIKTPDVVIGTVVDVLENTKQVFVGSEDAVSYLPLDITVTSSNLLKILDITKE